jgi:hypothetical protein
VQRKPPAERKPLNDTTNTYKGLTPSRSRTSKEKEKKEKKAEKNRVFLRDAFEAVWVAVAERNLPLIGCISHQKEMMTAAIFQYLILRFRCFSKAKFIEIVEQKKTESHAQMKKKLGKFVRR